jgi:hypothetical protein
VPVPEFPAPGTLRLGWPVNARLLRFRRNATRALAPTANRGGRRAGSRSTGRPQGMLYAATAVQPNGEGDGGREMRLELLTGQTPVSGFGVVSTVHRNPPRQAVITRSACRGLAE